MSKLSNLIYTLGGMRTGKLSLGAEGFVRSLEGEACEVALWRYKPISQASELWREWLYLLGAAWLIDRIEEINVM